MSRLVALTLLLSSGLALGQTPSYSKHIQPFFTRYCVECHNAQELEGALSLENFKALMEGGKRGPAIEPGKPDASRLVRMIEGKLKPAMPPKRSRQPSKAEIALVRAWVLAGAVNDATTAPARLPTLLPRVKVATPVAALAWSPSGKLLAATGRGEVLLLDAATGELRHRLPAGRDRVTALAFSARGDTLAAAASTAGEAHEVRVWSMQGDSPGGTARLVGKHDDVIQDIAFSPDGKLLATAGYDRLIKLHDVTAGKIVHTLKDHSDSVYGVAFSPDGKLLASGGADRAVKVWEVSSGNRLYTLGECTDWVYAVAFSPDGKHLAAGGVDRSIRLWKVDRRSGDIVHSTFAHEKPITRLVYSQDGKTLYSLSEDRTVKAWATQRMVERRAYPAQPETLLALSVRADEKEIAIGRFDGALLVLDGVSGKTLRQLLPIKPRPPVLVKFTPDVLVRGRATEVRFTGKNLTDTQVLSTLPGAITTVVHSTPTSLTVRIQPTATTEPGKYTLRLKNEAGESDRHNFLVDRYIAVDEAEMNDSARTGQKISLPATVVGAISRAGDLDWFRFEAKAGQQIGVQALTGTIGSGLGALLKLVDPEGNTVAESASGVLGHICSRAGVYSVGIRDLEYRGTANMTYRLYIGDIPVVTSIFPLGLQRGTSADVRLDGVNLGKLQSVRVSVPATAQPGSRVPLPLSTASETPLGMPSLIVGEFPEIAGGKDAMISTPGTANGVIASPGATQTWRFQARKGQRLILEVNAARIGSPLDSTMEILDQTGRPLPRAVLRSLARTYVVFRDHDSRSPGIRIETWSELAVNDYILVGSELLRIRALPRNPDDDCRFFEEQGQRIGYLGTTPVFQPQGTPMYKVAIHPPGEKFPPNGLPLVTVFWRNDDGGPGLGKDSRLVFDAPADGTYQVRIGDSRGEGSAAHAYRLTVRPPRPDFTVRMSVPGTVNKGSAAVVRVNVTRLDEFEGDIDLKLNGLPAGFHAPATNIPGTDNSTALALYAEPGAVVPAQAPTLELVAKAVIDGKEVVRKATGKLPRVVAPGDIVTTTEQSEVAIRPGGEARVTVTVERRNGFTGRIPLDVQGLPHGVRVLDVGLNGILITPAETKRTFVLYCEPWVKEMKHPIVVLSRREGKGTEYAARSVLLRVAK